MFFLVAILFNLPHEMLGGFLIWLMGVVVYILQPKLKKLSTSINSFTLVVALILFFCVLIISKSHFLHEINPLIIDFLIGLVFAFLSLALTNYPFPQKRFKWFANISLMLSEMSYSLYLSHFPLVLMVAVGVYKSQKTPLNNILLMQFLCWVVLLLGFAGMMWFLFESRTKELQLKFRRVTTCLFRL